VISEREENDYDVQDKKGQSHREVEKQAQQGQPEGRSKKDSEKPGNLEEAGGKRQKGIEII
jgi:hypothetical protein